MNNFTYIILYAGAPEELSFRVNRALKEGWLLHGSPYAIMNTYSVQHCQAMLRDEGPAPSPV